MTIKFVDSVPDPYRGKWVVVAEQLRAQPGEWAEVVRATRRSPSASAFASLSRLGCEVRARQSNGEFFCYARWPHPES